MARAATTILKHATGRLAARLSAAPTRRSSRPLEGAASTLTSVAAIKCHCIAAPRDSSALPTAKPAWIIFSLDDDHPTPRRSRPGVSCRHGDARDVRSVDGRQARPPLIRRRDRATARSFRLSGNCPDPRGHCRTQQAQPTPRNLRKSRPFGVCCVLLCRGSPLS